MKREDLSVLVRRFFDQVERRHSDLAERIVEIDTARYTDPARAVREKARLFRALPQIVGMSCDLREAGSFFTRTIADVPIVVTRTRSGDLRAFVNACTHRGAEVVSGCGNATRWTCPYHAWSFESESGHLAAIPYEDGFEGLDRAAYGLTPLPCEERFGLIAVVPTPGAELDLAAYLGELGPEFGSFGFEDLWRVDESLHRISSNWKLANDTGQEGYHVPFLHKDSVAPMTIPNVTLYDRYGDHHRLGFASPEILALRDQPESEWDALPKFQLVYGVFPSTTIVVSHHLIALQRLDPGPTPGECTFRLATYSIQPMQTDEHRNFAQMMFEGMLSLLRNEDYVTVEKMQRNSNAGVVDRIVLGRNEPALQMIHAAYDRCIADD